MRYITFCLVLFGLIFSQSCDRSSEASETKSSEKNQSVSPDLQHVQQNERQTPAEAEVARLEPAVPDPVQEEQKISNLVQSKPVNSGLEFAMNLPDGYTIATAKGTDGILIYAQEGGFQLIVKETASSLPQMRKYWEDGPDGLKFSRWLINGENGLLVEMEKEGKAVYHVDYLYEGNINYRLTTPVDKSFSQFQATQMFHSCRMIAGLNQKTR
ncbi:MAG: hypothetical protein R3D00_02935 [Bacteroidia bacterium]